MTLLLRYFWFICGGFLLINVAVWWRRLEKLVLLGRITRKEAITFTRSAAIAIVAFCLALGLIALWAGFQSPICVQPFSFDEPASAASNVVTLVCWVMLLWWVWRGSGADLLARIAPVLGNRPNYSRTYSPQTVRLAVTGFLLITAVGGFFASRLVPVDLVCRHVSAN